MGRNRQVWLYILRLAALLEALAWGLPAAIGQVGPALSGPMPSMAGPPAGMSAAANQFPPPATNPPGLPTMNSPAPASSVEMVVDVRIAGNKSLPLSKILPHIRTRAGRPFDLELISEDVRRLDRTHLFVNVQTYSQQVPGGRIVVFDLLERPLLTDVLFVGCREIRKRTLQKEANIKTGDPADTIAIEEARRKLEEYYHTHGFNGARIALLEGDKPEDRRAIFLVNEGTKQQVWNTKFVGNTIADDGRLRTQIATSRPFLWLFGGEFEHKKLDDDIKALTGYYRGLGFFRARIGRKVEENDKQNWVTITYIIDEGPRYKVRNVSVIGNAKYTNEELLADMKLHSGDYFNQAKMTVDKNQIVDKYGSVGYVFADIRPDPRLLEEPAQLDVIYNIKEGAPYRVGKIHVVIKGEYPHTQLTTVLNRLSFKPGELVDIRKIRESESSLKRSQLFEVNPATGNPPKIAFSPPGQEEPDDESDDKPKTKTGHGAGRGGLGRGMGRGVSPGGDDGDGMPTYRSQSPDSPGVLDVTLDCGRYIGPGAVKQGAEVRGQGSEETGAAPAPTNARPLQWAGPSAGPSAGAENDPLQQKTRELTAALAQRRIERTGVIPTQYSPGAGQVNPAVQPPQQWPATAPPAVNPNYPPPATGYALAQLPAVAANAPPPSPPTQAAPVQPAPAYGQQMWPTPVPQRPVDSPQGPYDPLPIFGENSPFRGGPADGGNEPPTLLPFGVTTQEAMTGRLMVGVGINSDAGLVGSVVLDEQNFDWTKFPTSWEEIRNGTAWRGAGQRFNVSLTPGIATTPGTAPLQQYMVTFENPYIFDTQVSMGLRGEYYNRAYTQYTDTRLGGRIWFGYQFTPNFSTSIAYRGDKINISNPVDPLLPALASVTGRDLALHEFQISVGDDHRDNAYLATQGYLIQASFAEVLGSYEYPHAEVNLRKYFMLYERPDGSGRHVLSLAARAGFTADNTPIYERYYAGGYSSLRGFQFRGVSPTEYDPINGITTAVGGDFQLLASAEYLFPITADDMLRGVFFCDSGTVEPTVSQWTNKFRVAPGFGLRIVVPAMGPAPIALDFAFPVSWQPGDQQEMFSFFMGFQR
jgi:outer membrane protein insertion porin family